VQAYMDQECKLETVSRILPTTGIHNFRDYGGYPIAEGGHLLRGRLYRCAEFLHPTGPDLRLLDSLGLATVFDLRGGGERRSAPCRFPPGFSASVVYSDGETAHSYAAPHIEGLGDALNADQARIRMLNAYTSMPFRPLLVNVLRLYFRALAELKGPTLVFCAAGKDRTGFAVAMLHTALGVHHDDILEDYLLTNSAGDREARIAALRQDMERRFNASLSEEAVRVASSVEAAWLDRAFEVITDRHGSIDAYLAEVLQVTPQLRDALATHLIA
jgi:protein-tyrosine phosphatase